MENTSTYTVVIYTENSTGLLSQFSNIFTRRSLDIWSLTAAPSDIEGIMTLTIVTNSTRKKIDFVVMQLEKRVEVVRAYHVEGDLASAQVKALHAGIGVKYNGEQIDTELRSCK